jgi:hypothetical protein
VRRPTEGSEAVLELPGQIHVRFPVSVDPVRVGQVINGIALSTHFFTIFRA